MTELADWQERLPHMKGDAVQARGASYFEVPLFSQIKDNLWMGCSPSEFPDGFDPDDMHTWSRHYEKPYRCKWLWESEVVGHGVGRFDAILNLFVYPGTEYVRPIGIEYEEFTMSDGDEVIDNEVNRLAGTVIDWLKEEKKTLVHCQAGLNRSSLVVARTLMLGQDMTAKEAIALIREKRSLMCLCNETFRTYLERFDG